MSYGNDIDLCFARLKQNTEKIQSRAEDGKKAEKFLKQIEDEIKKAEGLFLKQQTFFNGLFIMLVPAGLTTGLIQEENLSLFQSHADRMTLAVKVIKTGIKTDMEYLKEEYLRLMLLSKQQTEILMSGTCEQDEGNVYYFCSVHSMPEEKQCDFIVIFQIREQTVLMDFSFPQCDFFCGRK